MHNCNSKKTLVVITGQIRNGADNLKNWLETIFPDKNVSFLFFLWDIVGRVDSNKLYINCLRTRKHRGHIQTEISRVQKYLCLERSLESEIKKIKKLLGDRAIIVVNPYLDSYMTKAGDLEVTNLMQAENTPWWQGSVPIAYINHLAYQYIIQKELDRKFDHFFRIQSEAFFNKGYDYKSLLDGIEAGQLLTSPDSIDPRMHVSIKFFGGEFNIFSLLMDAYTPLINAYKHYEPGLPFANRPIGERFLKQLIVKNSIETNYGIRMRLTREKVIPINPKWKEKKWVEKNWEKPTLISVGEEAYKELGDIFRSKNKKSITSFSFFSRYSKN